LADDLTVGEYGVNAREEIQFEGKENMKDRGLSSPDHGDGLALTFAMPVGALEFDEPTYDHAEPDQVTGY